jgi:hypothetical protein
LERLLAEKQFGDSATRVSQAIKQENGPAMAADLIEQHPLRNKNIEEFAYASGD